MARGKLMPQKAGMVFLALLFLLLTGSTPLALAQDDGHFDASLGFAGVFPKQSTGNGTILNPTNSAAVVASFRYRFNPTHSVEFNYASTRDSQVYTTGANQFRIMSKVSEYSFAYVLNIFQRGKFEPFLFGGAGALVFHPGNTYINTYALPVFVSKQTELAFLYGAGVDYRVVPHVAVRFQYRGLVYKAPDFAGPNFLTSAKGNLAEPSIGVVFRF
jgi:outer membrane immunogenic protein